MSELLVLADAIVPWDKLGKVVVASFAAGVGVSAIFGFAIFGASRAVDLSRDGRTPAATAYAALALASLAVVAVAIAFGLVVMISK